MSGHLLFFLFLIGSNPLFDVVTSDVKMGSTERSSSNGQHIFVTVIKQNGSSANVAGQILTWSWGLRRGHPVEAWLPGACRMFCCYSASHCFRLKGYSYKNQGGSITLLAHTAHAKQAFTDISKPYCF